MSKRVILVLALHAVLVAGCGGDGDMRPETDEQARTRLEDQEQRSGGKDPWAFLELGELDEQHGDLRAAVSHYGSSVALLPPFKYTRPAASLARVHRKLGNVEAARRLYEEVVETVPSDAARYRDNPDYREAVLALKDIYANQKDAPAAEKLRQRFLGEMGGTAEDWPPP